MLDVVEPRHIAAFLSPFERGDDIAGSPDLADIAYQLGVLTARSGQPITVPPEMQLEFALATKRLLDEPV